MTWRSRLLLPLLVPTLALAAPESSPAAKPQALQTAPASVAAKPSSKLISVEFHGPLREAIKKIASQGGLSVIVTGELDQSSDVTLTNASAEEALATVARLYDLKVEHEGNIYTVRPLSEREHESIDEARERQREEKEEQEQAEKDAKEANDDSEEPEIVTVPALPSMPAMPPIPPIPPMGVRDGKNLAGTGAVTVAEGETVHDAVAYGGPLSVNGHVEGDAVSFGGPVHLGEHSQVDGSVTAFGGGVTRDKGAVVKGKITSFGGVMGGHAIGASTAHDQDNEEQREGHHASFPGFLLRFALLFGLGFLLMLFAPNQVKQLGNELRQDPVRCLMVGVVGSFALLGLTIALCITIIGIPVAVALWMMAWLGLGMGITSLANEIGQRLPVLRTKKTQALVLAVGTLTLLLAWMIPYLGWVIFSLVSLLSLGATIRTRLGTRGAQGLPQTGWSNMDIREGAK